MLSLCAGRFNNFKAVSMKVIVSSVISLKSCKNIKKRILSLCTERGRTNNFKAVLRQTMTVKIEKKYTKFMLRR